LSRENSFSALFSISGDSIKIFMLFSFAVTFSSHSCYAVLGHKSQAFL
jgi:hypothetical protein